MPTTPHRSLGLSSRSVAPRPFLSATSPSAQCIPSCSSLRRRYWLPQASAPFLLSNKEKSEIWKPPSLGYTSKTWTHRPVQTLPRWLWRWGPACPLCRCPSSTVETDGTPHPDTPGHSDHRDYRRKGKESWFIYPISITLASMKQVEHYIHAQESFIERSSEEGIQQVLVYQSQTQNTTTEPEPETWGVPLWEQSNYAGILSSRWGSYHSWWLSTKADMGLIWTV